MLSSLEEIFVNSLLTVHNSSDFCWGLRIINEFYNTNYKDNSQRCSHPQASLHVDVFFSVDIDECALGPCKNGGNCTNTAGGYNCSCVGGWFTGKNCDEGKCRVT